MNELALFAGAGGGILGGKLLGWRTVCAVENERYARDILLARQNDRILEPFPIWDDVRSFDGTQWRGIVDVVSGGFPCQDISVARAMWGREGLDGNRSGLWRQMLRIVGEVRPTYVFGENSPALRTSGMEEIIQELAAIGYDCRWVTLGAEPVGLHHKRLRIWFLATDTHCERLERHVRDDAGKVGRKNKIGPAADASFLSCSWCGYLFSDDCGKYGCPNCCAEGPGANYDQGSGLLPRVTGMDNGVAYRVDRLRAVGNGQVPSVAALAWNLLRENS